jgi:excisionase family DNA binding protein
MNNAARQPLPQANNNSDARPENAITSESGEGYGQHRSRLLRRHPDLLDWDEAAAMLGCSKTTVKRLRRAGKIRVTPIGTGTRPRIWFHRKDIEAYLEAQRLAAQDDDEDDES